MNGAGGGSSSRRGRHGVDCGYELGKAVIVARCVVAGEERCSLLCFGIGKLSN